MQTSRVRRVLERLHDGAERGLRRHGAFVVRRRWTVLALSLLASLALWSGLPRLEADFSPDSYLLPGDDSLVRYDAFRHRFGLDERIMVAVETDDVFTIDFLEQLRNLQRDIEAEVPYLDDVTSLVNARDTRGEDDALVVGELMEAWPRSEADVEALRARALANPSYTDVYYAGDGRTAVIVLRPSTYSGLAADEDAIALALSTGDETAAEPEFLSAAETNEAIEALLAVADRHRARGLTIHVAGEEVIGYRATEISFQDVTLFSALSIAMTMVLLALLFRRVGGALVTIALVVLCAPATFGAMAWLGIPFSIPTQLIPTFIIAVSVCDAVHVLTLFYRAIDRGETRAEAVRDALGHSGFAIVMTSLTTAAGLFSFVAAEIAPVARLGIVAPIGVLIALALTLTFVPALLAVVPVRARPARSDPSEWATGWMVAVGLASARRPVLVLGVCLGLVVVAGLGVSRLRLSHDSADFLLEGDPVRIAVMRIDGALGGISTVEATIDTGAPGGLYEPDVLRRIEAGADFALALGEGELRVGKAMSIVDVVKEIHQALNGDDPARREIPDSRELVAQELLLFESGGSEDLVELTDADFRLARLTLRVPIVDAFHYLPFLERLRGGLESILGPGIDLDLTGSTVLGSRAFSVVLTSLVRSYALALAIITPLMVLMIGRLRLGLLTMIPNLLPVWLCLAMMGWLDIPLTISTLLVGSIVIGVAVDDTIHILHRFDRSLVQHGAVEPAVEETFRTTGRALLVTSIVLTLSFSIYMGGHMTGPRQFGVIAAFGTLAAFAADLFVSPALLALAAGRRVTAGARVTIERRAG